MITEQNIDFTKLTSAEMAQLWNTYNSDTMSICMLSYFAKNVQDSEIASVIGHALYLSRQHVKTITNIFNSVNFPIPHGFTLSDVNLNTKRLYSDSFMLSYLKNLAMFGMKAYGTAVATSMRPDVRIFFRDCLNTSSELSDTCDNVLIEKGLYVPPPFIHMPAMVEFTEKQGIIRGFLGDRRPLNAIEILHLYINIRTNTVGKDLITGFAQTAESSKVRNYMVRGKEIATKHIEVFSGLLSEDDIAVPLYSNSEVMDSTEHIFSDRLMVQHIGALIQLGAAEYGVAMTGSMRKDVSLTYGRLAAELFQYSKDGLDIMLDNEWFEKPPEALDWDKLLKV